MATETTRARSRKAAPAVAAEPATPRRKARPRPVAALEGQIIGKAETETLTAAAAPAKAVAERPTVTFRGRAMAIEKPDPLQVAVLMETLDDLGNVGAEVAEAIERGDEESKAGQRGMALTVRTMKGLLVVLADDEDQDWIRARVLDKRAAGKKITLNDLMDLFRSALTALGERRPAAPTTGPPPKARRRA